MDSTKVSCSERESLISTISLNDLLIASHVSFEASLDVQSWARSNNMCYIMEEMRSFQSSKNRFKKLYLDLKRANQVLFVREKLV
jgi:hypothetical protein